MHELIRTLIQRGAIASIYCDSNDDNAHLTGFIVACDDVDLLIAHISPHGLYDGYILIHLQDIFRIDFDGDYEHRIKTLYEAKKQSHRMVAVLKKANGTLRNTLLEFAKEQSLVVAFEFDESLLSGNILEIQCDEVKLQILDLAGKENGIATLQTDCIKSISVDTDDEQDVYLLGQLQV